jgi:hypothetical protein
MKNQSVFGFLAILLLSITTLKAQMWGDYTLYSVQNTSNAYLLDTTGAVYHTWTFGSTSKTGYSTYMMPGGKLVRSIMHSGNSFNGGGITGGVQIVDYSGTVLWDYVCSSSTFCMHHDICPMPNGNVLLIVYESKTAAEATQAGCSQSITIWSEKIIEVQPTGATTGNIVWEWHLWDHLVQNVNSAKDNYQTSIIDHPELMNINYNTAKDWFHMNGVDYNPILDQISLSSHNMNQWFIIDHSTTTAEAATHSGGLANHGGDFLYRWGNPASYGATGSTILNVTHDAHFVPEGCPNAGYLSGFNNKGVSNNISSIEQVDVPHSGYNYTLTPGSAYLPATYTSRHQCNGGSSNMGNAQQLPNGNMLVCLATMGSIYEVNPAGTTIWTKQLSGTVPQAFRYESCYLLNEAPQAPMISQSNDTLFSTGASTYQWYLDGVQIPGATDVFYVPAASGNYLVRINDGISCVNSYSITYKYTMIPTGVSSVHNANEFSIFPNPADGIINLNIHSSGNRNYTVQLFDANGRLVKKYSNVTLINSDELESGIYSVRVISAEGAVSSQNISVQH